MSVVVYECSPFDGPFGKLTGDLRVVFGRNLQETMLSSVLSWSKGLSKHDPSTRSTLMNQLERRSLVSPSLATVDLAIALKTELDRWAETLYIRD